MAGLTIGNLGDDMKQRLRVREAKHGHSLEEETWAILCTALADHGSPANLSRAIRSRFAPLGDAKLEIPPRGPMLEPPGSTFSETP